MSFERFIAKRIYAQTDEKRQISRPAIRIALIGIIIGMAVMIVSIAVVMGFKSQVSSKVVGFGAHIQVLSLTQGEDYELLPVLTTDSLERVIRRNPQVADVQRFATKMGMLKTQDDFRGIQFKGVDEGYDLSFFRQYLKEGKIPQFSSKEATNQLLVSQRIASDLHIQAGDKVYAYFVNESGMRARRFTVCGIYETHLSEYDRNVVMTDIYTIRRLNNWDSDMSTGFEITIKDYDRLDDVTQELVYKINKVYDKNGCMYGAFSIRQLAPHIFSWLGVLDMNVIMILVLMICVASFTVMSGLLIVMLERINMIGILKSLGATNRSVRQVFINFSVMLVGRGMLWGNVIGLALCFLQSQFHLVRLDPAVYYLDAVPIRFDWLLFLLVNAITLIISFIVIFGSSYLMSISRPAQTMRFE
ncbi:MAG: ABC transporter permease [Bacteroidaceae bacterium]|nr:ABC transporter permease [Bacteroidaceae bacterium]